MFSITTWSSSAIIGKMGLKNQQVCALCYNAEHPDINILDRFVQSKFVSVLMYRESTTI